MAQLDGGGTVNFEPEQSNTLLTLLLSAAGNDRTSSRFTNKSNTKLICFFEVTAIGTGTVTLELLGSDPITGKDFVVASGTARSAVGLYVETFTNVPREFKVRIQNSDGTNWTASVGGSLNK